MSATRHHSDFKVGDILRWPNPDKHCDLQITKKGYIVIADRFGATVPSTEAFYTGFFSDEFILVNKERLFDQLYERMV